MNLSRSLVFVGIFSIAAFLVTSLSVLSDDQAKRVEQVPEEKTPEVNLNLDTTTVEKIAEILLVKQYGERALKEKPWKVVDQGSTFRISGTLHGVNPRGGTAELVIKKVNGEVLRLVHYK